MVTLNCGESHILLEKKHKQEDSDLCKSNSASEKKIKLVTSMQLVIKSAEPALQTVSYIRKKIGVLNTGQEVGTERRLKFFNAWTFIYVKIILRVT